MEFAIFSYFQSQKLCYRFLQYFGEKIVMQFRKCRGGGILGFFRLSKILGSANFFAFIRYAHNLFHLEKWKKE